MVHSQVTANIEEATERIAAAAQPKLQAMVQHELSRFAADRTVRLFCTCVPRCPAFCM